MGSNKLRELAEEFRTVFTRRGHLIDAILPPIIFLILNAFLSSVYALLGGSFIAIIILLLRLTRHDTLRYALGGAGAVALAAAVTLLIDRTQGYLLPEIASSSLTVLGTIISLIVEKPLVAWTSHIARGWPLEWYWHPKVRPAYTEVTLAWTAFFAIRLLLQILIFRSGAPRIASILALLTGWPATIVLLVASYLYGQWRLQNLKGPSVEEFKTDASPPWEGQQRGF